MRKAIYITGFVLSGYLFAGLPIAGIAKTHAEKERAYQSESIFENVPDAVMQRKLDKLNSLYEEQIK